jgi:hypothetical protein
MEKRQRINVQWRSTENLHLLIFDYRIYKHQIKMSGSEESELWAKPEDDNDPLKPVKELKDVLCSPEVLYSAAIQVCPNVLDRITNYISQHENRKNSTAEDIRKEMVRRFVGRPQAWRYDTGKIKNNIKIWRKNPTEHPDNIKPINKQQAQELKDFFENKQFYFDQIDQMIESSIAYNLPFTEEDLKLAIHHKIKILPSLNSSTPQTLNVVRDMFDVEMIDTISKINDFSSELKQTLTEILKPAIKKIRKTKKYDRDQKIPTEIKFLYKYKCLKCGYHHVLNIADGAHLCDIEYTDEYSKEYITLDRKDNMICLCKNCHAEFDNGGWIIDPDTLDVFENKICLFNLKERLLHEINPLFIALKNYQLKLKQK